MDILYFALKLTAVIVNQDKKPEVRIAKNKLIAIFSACKLNVS
jgi:hypothetical protein